MTKLPTAQRRASSSRRRAGCYSAWLGFAAVTMACGLDDRQLNAAEQDDVSVRRRDAARAPLVGADEEDEGDAGSAASDVLVDGCADLDTDGVPDCEPGLLANASFESDVEGWTAGSGALVWDPHNALGDDPSGSVRLTSAVGHAMASQCVRLRGERLVVVYANAFVAATDAGAGSEARVEVGFYEDSACVEPAGPFFSTPGARVSGEWLTIHAGGLSGANNRSLLVTLIGSSGRIPDAVEVHFDNVMLKATQPP